MQQWHFDVQHELPGHTVLTVSYVGSKGTHLNRQRDLNQLLPVLESKPVQAWRAHRWWTAITQIDLVIPLTTTASAGAHPTSEAAAYRASLRLISPSACGGDANPFRPFYGISARSLAWRTVASSNYNALQVSVRKTVGALSLSLAYTYSHSIDDSSDRYDGNFVNSYDFAASRASSNFDERHMLQLRLCLRPAVLQEAGTQPHAPRWLAVFRDSAAFYRNAVDHHQWHDVW